MFAGIENIFLPIAQFNYSGGVGNIVAATLETKGLIDQAAILANFKDVLEWIAAAAWLFSICMGLGAVAVFGNYKQGAYLLVGPPLFYYMVNTTIQTDGTKAIFGDRVVNGSIEEERNLLKWVKTIGDGNETVDISFFFGVYDSIITEVVQKVVSVMLDTKNQADLRYVARESVLSQVLLTIPEDREFANLVLTYHVGACGEEMGNLQQEAARKDQVRIRLRETANIESSRIKTVQSQWITQDVALSRDVKRFVLTLKDTAAADGVTIPYTSEDDERVVSCQQIWDFTRVALLKYAKERLNSNSLQETAVGSNLPLKEAVKDVREWLEDGAMRAAAGEEPVGGAPKTIDAEKILAIFIYKNMLTKMTPDSVQGQVFNRSPMNTAQYEAVFGRLGNSEAHGGYMKMKYFAASIPYIQGLLLYLLAIAFPFFAVFLVLPGKAPSFLVWCSLWAWVKSWDIGFALVHVGRDIFWHMMKHSVNIHGTEIKWGSDPSSVIRFAFQNDPLFNQNTYWVIAAALTLMVPFVTAHLAMGATGMVDMFKGSIDQVANRFSQGEGNAGRRHEANISERMMEEHNARAIRQAARAHARDAGATLMNGTKMALQNLRRGASFGLFTFDENNNVIGRTDGVTDGRAAETPMAGILGGFALQMGTPDYLSGGRESSIAKADEIAGQHKKINEEASNLQGRVSAMKDGQPSTEAEKADKEALLKMRAEHGYHNDTKDIQPIIGQLQAQINGGQLKGDDLEKAKGQLAVYQDQVKVNSQVGELSTKKVANTASGSELKKLEELEARYDRGKSINLPEYMPHAERGVSRTNERMDVQSMKSYATDNREMAELYKQYGRHLDADRFEQRSRDVSDMVNTNSGQSLSWGQYYSHEQRVGDSIQDGLTTESRRRQYKMKRFQIPAMAKYLQARQSNAMNAQNYYDTMSNIKNIAISEPHKRGFINPTGAGIKIEVGKGLFSGAGVGKFGTSEGGENADD